MKLKTTFGFSLIFSLIFVCANQLNAQNNNDEVIKIDTALVNIPVIVSDRNGRNIAGLKVDNFNVFQDGEKQKIEYFVSEETPINVAILLDTSRSTQEVLGNIKKAAKEFIKQLRPDDKAMIVSFDNDVQILSELTSNRDKLKDAINDAEIGERVGTVLHDAVYEVVNKRFASIKGRKAMILLTDGKDFGSFVNQTELIRETEESDTLIYSIFYETGNPQQRIRQNRFPDMIPFPRNNRFPNRRRNPDNFPRQQRQEAQIERIRQRNQMENQQAIEFLQTLSDNTAGRLYQKNVGDLKETFGLIADELRKQYLLGYYPEKTDEGGKLHQIKVRTDLENAIVRAKANYRSQKTQ